MAKDTLTRYPKWDVMSQAKEWDFHTRQIVEDRLLPGKRRTLTMAEKQQLTVVCSGLLADDREEILDYVIGHIDKSVSDPIGESQRKVGIPPGEQLIRRGLSALNAGAMEKYGKGLAFLHGIEISDLLRDLQRGEAPGKQAWEGVPQKEFWDRLMLLSVESYYSHPTVWSEIGYAGPAYPRGYVRLERGLVDPWEAVEDGNR